MKNYEEQALAGIELDDDAVMQYLLQNPDFFIRNARLVEQMHIPPSGQRQCLAGGVAARTPA